MQYLGWDCADKSLAWVRVTINYEIGHHIRQHIVRLEEILSTQRVTNLADSRTYLVDQNGGSMSDIMVRDLPKLMTEINSLIDILKNFIVITSCGAVNLLGIRKVKEVSAEERTKKLRLYLDDEINVQVGADIIVLIERQAQKIGPKCGGTSIQVAHQLAHHFAYNELHFVDPRAKNKLHFSDDLKFENYLNKYSNKYLARKAHAKDNLLFYLQIVGREYLLNGIEKKFRSDVADAFMEILAFCFMSMC